MVVHSPKILSSKKKNTTTRPPPPLQKKSANIGNEEIFPFASFGYSCPSIFRRQDVLFPPRTGVPQGAAMLVLCFPMMN